MGGSILLCKFFFFFFVVIWPYNTLSCCFSDWSRLSYSSFWQVLLRCWQRENQLLWGWILQWPGNCFWARIFLPQRGMRCIATQFGELWLFPTEIWAEIQWENWAVHQIQPHRAFLLHWGPTHCQIPWHTCHWLKCCWGTWTDSQHLGCPGKQW